jgi:hypothetical protein
MGIDPALDRILIWPQPYLKMLTLQMGRPFPSKASWHLIDRMSECLEAHGCAGKAMASSRHFLQRSQVQS